LAYDAHLNFPCPTQSKLFHSTTTVKFVYRGAKTGVILVSHPARAANCPTLTSLGSCSPHWPRQHVFANERTNAHALSPRHPYTTIQLANMAVDATPVPPDCGDGVLGP